MRAPAFVGRRVCGGVLVLLFAVAALSCVRRPSTSAPVLAPGREAAYRANNRGVALLERDMPNQAVDAFREALADDPDMRLAAVNLPIALYYAGRDGEAEKASAAARARYPDAPQPLYVLGLVAQAANRLDEALAAYSSLRQFDPGDVAVLVQMSQIYNQRQQYEAATAMADTALTAEPYNATAAYNLALARARSGDREGGARAAARFQALTAAPYGITYSRSYLSQGRYAEALVSTGLESDLVGLPTPAVTFVRVSNALPALQPSARTDAAAATAGRSVTLADIDGDGDLDVIAASGVLRVLRNDGMRFTDVTTRTGLAIPGTAILGAVVGDIDNDGTQDVLLLTGTGPRILAGRKNTAFEALPDRTLPVEAPAPAHAAALTDVDHDGDLDIVIGGSRASSQLLRNNGNGTFKNVTREAGLAGVSAVVAVAPTDFDKRRDIDLLLLAGDAPRLFRNLRTGAFADVAAESGLPGRGEYTTLTLGDVNKDGTADIFLGRQSGPGLLALSTGRGAFRVEAAPPTSSARVAQLLDYDNDGLLDLLVGGTSGLRIWRGTGAAWDDRTAMVFPAPAPTGIAAVTAGDLDDDGDLDLLAMAIDGELQLLRNDGGSRNRSLRVSLASLVSNRGGVGSKVDLRAGSLYQSVETSATAPAIAPATLLFGLGGRADADVVRILWPAGILQAEPVTARAANARMTIRELNRKPSSCPYLFVWDGTRFVFVTDFLGGGEMGYWLAPGVRNVPNPVEYVRITDTRLKPRNGRLELRITNELEEVLFLDAVRLLSIPHDAGTEIYPDEGLRAAAPRPRVFAVREIRPLARAADDHGHDVLDAVASVDRRAPDDFARLPIRGYAHPHTLTFALPRLTPRAGERVVLLLTGSTDYAFSRDNVAGHQAGYALVPPALEQQLPDGTWAVVTPDVGVPVGRPQTLVVDVTDVVPGGALRLTTTMSIYWDRIAAGVATAHAIDETTAIPPVDVRLRWRGYSAPVAADRSSAVYDYDYGSVGSNAPWKLMTGRYTREGEVGELVEKEDDRLVISRPGDELAVAFDVSKFPPAPHGQRRTYLLRAVGYSKEMDVHSASPDEAGPLPFKKMSGYPYPASESYPHPDDLERFHTRVVPRPIPSLDRILATAP